MLEAQIKTILYGLGDANTEDMTAYLKEVYQEAYLGCLYGLHGDSVDLILRIDEAKVERCLNRDTKDLRFSQRIYRNVDQLKEAAKREIARGFSTGRDYAWIARQLSLKTEASFARMCTIARTEGHRVMSESEMDCMNTARSKGAAVVKEWISTLDDVTRDTHRELDGQIRELEEYFVIPSTGAKAMYPGGFGIAGEDINCRCCMNQRARWNLESEEYRYSRAAGEVVSIRSDVYREWKNRYNEVAKGLRVGQYFFGVEDHEPPRYIGKIDPANADEVNRALASFETENRAAAYENALVITRDGHIYECHGTEQSVYPDADLGEWIRGAVITHNHPATYTEYSFSRSDCRLFEKYGLRILRGVDERYIYELTRLNVETDEVKSIFELENEVDGRHQEVIAWATQNGYGYKRKKKDDQRTG